MSPFWLYWQHALELILTPEVQCKTYWLVLSRHNLSMSHKASCNVMECLVLSVSKCPLKCSVGMRSGDCGGKSMTVRTPWPCLVFKWFWLSKVQGVFVHYPAAVWILLYKPESVACLLRMEWYSSLVRVESVMCSCLIPDETKQPQTWIYSHHMFHCGFEIVWYRSLSCSSPCIHTFCYCHH